MTIAALIIIGILLAGLGLAKLTDRPTETIYVYDDEPEPADESPKAESEALQKMLAPLRQYTKPSKGPLEVYGWTVRKQEDDLWAVVPYDMRGNLLWNRAPYTDLTDSRLAWDYANVGRRALKWRE